MNNKSYQSELDTYFKAINLLEVAERILYKGNLSKARAKLKFEAFIELNDRKCSGGWVGKAFRSNPNQVSVL